jgi:hypothetical protein
MLLQLKWWLPDREIIALGDSLYAVIEYAFDPDHLYL